MSQSFDVGRLHKEELIYELKVRGLGVKDTDTVETLRGALRSAIRLQADNTFGDLPEYPYTFAEDVAAVKALLATLEPAVASRTPAGSKVSVKRWRSALFHVYGRIRRTPATSADEKNQIAVIKSDIMRLLNALEGPAPSGSGAGDASMVAPLASSSANPVTLESDAEEESDPEVDKFVSRLRPVHPKDWGLCYSAVPGEKSIVAFLMEVEQMRRRRKVARLDLFNSALDLFSGRAATFVAANLSKWSCWEELAAAVRHQYAGPNYEMNLMDAIRSRTQGAHESIGDYVAAMEVMFSRLLTPLPEGDRLKWIATNLHPTYTERLVFMEYRTISELVERCQRIEVGRAMAAAYKPPPPKGKFLEPDLAYVDEVGAQGWASSVEETGTSKGSCWLCKGNGHFRSACPRLKEGPVCFQCGERGVTSTNCSRCSGRRRKSGNASRGRTNRWVRPQ